MLKKYLYKTLDYGVGTIFNKLLWFLLVPIFTANLVPEEYAIYSNITIFISFAGLFYSLGLQHSIFSYFNDDTSDEYRFTFISTVFILIIFAGIILSAFIAFEKNLISNFSIRSTQYSHLFYFAAVIILTDSLYIMTLNFLNIMEKSRTYVLLATVKTVLLIIFIAFFIFTDKFSLYTIFVSLSLAAVISAVVAIIYIYVYLNKLAQNIENKNFFSPVISGKILKFGLIMIPGSLAFMLLRMSDRYMITYLSYRNVKAALANAGIYALGYRIGMIMQFAVSLISLVYYPFAMRISRQDSSFRSYRIIYKFYLITGTVFAFLIILFSKEIFAIFVRGDYKYAIKIVAFSVISAFLSGIFNIFNIGFYITKRAKSIAIVVSSGALINIFLNFIFIPRYGIIAAGFTSVIAYLFIVLFGYFMAKRATGERYNISAIFFSLSILILPTLNNIYPFFESLLLKFVLTIVILSIFTIYTLNEWKKYRVLR